MNTVNASESPIRIYILGQNRLLRQAFVHLLRKRSGFTVAGDCDDFTDALKELAENPCDVLLINSLVTLRAIRQRTETLQCLSTIKVVMIGMDEDAECFLEAVRLGSCGYSLKEASSAEIIEAVRGVARGEAFCSPKLCKSLFNYLSKMFFLHSGKVEPRGRAANELTCRQRRLMALVAKGMTNKEIAASLQLSEFTVKNHVRRIMAHLQADSRHAAVDVIRAGGFFLSV